MGSSGPLEGPAVSRAKEDYLHFSVFFKALSISPAPGIKMMTSLSAVKQFAD